MSLHHVSPIFSTLLLSLITIVGRAEACEALLSCLKTFPVQGLAPGPGLALALVPGRCLLFAATCRALYWLAQVIQIHPTYPTPTYHDRAIIHLRSIPPHHTISTPRLITPSPTSCNLSHPLNKPSPISHNSSHPPITHTSQQTISSISHNSSHPPLSHTFTKDDKNLASMRDESFSSPSLVDILVSQLKGLVTAQGTSDVSSLRGATDVVGGAGVGVGLGVGATGGVGVGPVGATEEGLVLLATLLGATGASSTDPSASAPPSIRMDIGSTADMVMIVHPPLTHYTTIHYTTLHYTTLHYTLSRQNALHSLLTKYTPLLYSFTSSTR